MTGTGLIHTAMLGTCHDNHVPGKISFSLIANGMCLAWHVPGTASVNDSIEMH